MFNNKRNNKKNLLARARKGGMAGAQAEVHARGEREVRVGVGPAYVEGRRVLEDGRVAVGAAEVEQDAVARREVPAPHLGVAQRDPQGELDRRLVAQHLVDRIAPAVGVLLQPAQLVGVLVEQRDRVGRHLRRRIGGGIIALR